MSFLEDIFASLQKSGESPTLQEIRDGRITPMSGRELLEEIAHARAFLAARGLKKGDRCALYANNGVRWVAMDLAIMAEGLIVVPLYARQAPAELAAMMKDCSPALVCCGDATLRDGLVHEWPAAPPQFVFEEIFSTSPAVSRETNLADGDPVTIIYTSGTSGEAKGVVLNAGNIAHMLKCINGRLDRLMGSSTRRDRVFHYLPFVFAGSWMLLLTSLTRGSVLTMNTDLGKIAQDMRTLAPDYFLNVPALLERMRRAVDEQLWQAGGFVQAIYSRAKSAWMRKHEQKSNIARLVLAVAGQLGDFPDHPQEDDRPQPARLDLRVGASGCRNAAFLHDARHPGLAELRPHRDYSNLHSRRSPGLRGWPRGARDSRH